ncbi:MAG: type VI secretion system baseplate subunit TssE [Desulfobacterales bacterium]|nr:MAG: type VI secretion system baseplate subunit TssE [Desulfobacterales bacterium]
MPELTQKERLQPSLLDRLADDEPEKKVESREQRVLSFQKLKQSVRRDLEWLLNAGCLETTQDLSAYPQVKQSVLNFGIPDLTGTTASNADSTALLRVLRQAILDFEPRILPQSLRVRAAAIDEHNTITFEIEGELWSQPTPERLYLKTILDLELGDVEVRVEG